MSKLEKICVLVSVWFLCWGVTWKPLQADDSSRYDLTSLAWIFPKDMQHRSSEDWLLAYQKKKMILRGREELKQACEGFLCPNFFFFSARGTFLKVIQKGWGSIFFHFFLNHALGKLQKLNRKYEIWKFKKRHKTSPKWQKKKRPILRNRTFFSLLIVPEPTLWIHYPLFLLKN